jgi:ERCC4-type nuclease
MSIRVVIDIREDDLWAQLEPYRAHDATEGWWVEKATLDVGDIAFYAATDVSGANPLAVIERKTAEDLGASQKDGRYREQRARLLALRGAKTAIAYLVEAPHWSPSLSTSWCRGTFNEVNLQQAIVRLQLRYTIPVFQAANLKETTQWIRRIAKALAADPTVFQEGLATTACEAAAAYTEAIHVKKADNNTPERIFLSFLLSIPGLGKAAATAVAETTKNSLVTLQTLTEEELCEIKAGKRKLGKALASVIYAAVHS